MKRKILTAVVLGFFILFGLQVYRKIAKSAKTPVRRPPQTAIAVEVAPVKTKAISNMKHFTGSLQPRSQFIVAPKVAGRLEKLLVNMGDKVEKGQLIAMLDSQEYQQDIEQAKAELDVAKANISESESVLDIANKEFERIKVLSEKKIASEAELDTAEANRKTANAKYRVALAQVQQREAALKAAEVRLSFTMIRASWEGRNENRVVGKRYVDEGEMLSANSPIVSIMDIDSLTAVINVTEKDYSEVNVGHSIVLTTAAHAGRKFTGTVVRKSPALKETSRTASVEVEVPNPEHLLKPGMFVRAEVELARRDGVAVVPFAALTKRDNKQGVFLLDEEDMKVHFVPVETGIITTDCTCRNGYYYHRISRNS